MINSWPHTAMIRVMVTAKEKLLKANRLICTLFVATLPGLSGRNPVERHCLSFRLL